MKTLRKSVWLGVVSLMIPIVTFGQGGGTTGQLRGLQGVLNQLYDEMIPLCGSLIGVGRGIAGLAALCYIGSRVWKSLARAEPIDFYPLLRPFALGMAILMFPAVLGIINGLMQPLVRATAHMAGASDQAVEMLLKQKTEAQKNSDAWQMYTGMTGEGDRDRWYQYTHPDASTTDEGIFEGIGDDIRFAMAKASYHFRSSIKEWMSEVLQVLFQAAALCINTLRTFNLIILAILGPLVLGLSVFDGFSHTLSHWLARYIHVFLWLPVANIFGAVIGKIQEAMLKIDLSQIAAAGHTFFSPTDVAYLVFLIIAILGYFSVPSVASHVVWAGGGVVSGRMGALMSALAGGMIATATRPGLSSVASPVVIPQGAGGASPVPSASGQTGSGDSPP